MGWESVDCKSPPGDVTIDPGDGSSPDTSKQGQEGPLHPSNWEPVISSQGCLRTQSPIWPLKVLAPSCFSKLWTGTSLAAQWLRLVLPLQGCGLKGTVELIPLPGLSLLLVTKLAP